MRARGSEAEMERTPWSKKVGSKDALSLSPWKTLTLRARVAKMSKLLSLLGDILPFHINQTFCYSFLLCSNVNILEITWYPIIYRTTSKNTSVSSVLKFSNFLLTIIHPRFFVWLFVFVFLFVCFWPALFNSTQFSTLTLSLIPLSLHFHASFYFSSFSLSFSCLICSIIIHKPLSLNFPSTDTGFWL